jgi:hypothetical protein
MKLAVLMLALTSIRYALAVDLDASASCRDGRVVVTNESGDVWTDVRIEVNGTYKHTADAIAPKTTLRFFAQIFSDSKGERLNLSRLSCKTIDIHATTPKGRQHWNGARK